MFYNSLNFYVSSVFVIDRELLIVQKYNVTSKKEDK